MIGWVSGRVGWVEAVDYCLPLLRFSISEGFVGCARRRFPKLYRQVHRPAPGKASCKKPKLFRIRNPIGLVGRV